MATKFLVIRFSSIGDIIQCMGIVGGIKRQFPDAEIHWITRKDMSSFLAMDRRIDRIWAFDKQSGLKGLWEIGRLLQKEHFDYVYDAHSNLRSNILRIRLFPILGHRPFFALRHKERWKRFLLFKWRINLFPQPFRGMVSYRKPLEKWGITDFSSDFRDWNFPQDFRDKFRSLITEKTVTLVPSANWPKKRWPVAHWKKLVELLPSYHFLILAGPADSFCEEIRQVAPQRVVNLSGQTSLLESCYLIHQSKIVISADTGFLHAADLFGIRTLALMGPTAFGYPSGKNTEALEVPLPCRPCTKDGSGNCKLAVYQKCLVDITPESVAREINKWYPKE